LTRLAEQMLDRATESAEQAGQMASDNTDRVMRDLQARLDRLNVPDAGEDNSAAPATPIGEPLSFDEARALAIQTEQRRQHEQQRRQQSQHPSLLHLQRVTGKNKVAYGLDRIRAILSNPATHDTTLRSMLDAVCSSVAAVLELDTPPGIHEISGTVNFASGARNELVVSVSAPCTADFVLVQDVNPTTLQTVWNVQHNLIDAAARQEVATTPSHEFVDGGHSMEQEIGRPLRAFTFDHDRPATNDGTTRDSADSAADGRGDRSDGLD